MTEVEWNASTDPVAMLDWSVQHHKPSDRKLRLAACAAFRLQAFGEHQFARVDLLEQFADGKIEREKAIRKIEGDPFDWSLWYAAHPNAEEAARLSLAEPSGGKAAHILRDIIGNPFRLVTLPVGEKCEKCKGFGKVILRYYQQRDVPPDSRNCDTCHGTGHGPSPVLTPLVKSLAEAAYQERREDGTLDPDRLEILADALIDAGMPEWVECPACDGDGVFEWGLWKDFKTCHRCDGTGRQPHPLLAHLREPGPHYRGCFAIDLLTGR